MMERQSLMRLWSSFLYISTLFWMQVHSHSEYLIGLGSYDITGPAADVNMMGYADTAQVASGIHFRLRARTFIVSEPQGKPVVFVNIDACMASQIVTLKVIERLKARYGDLYTEKNVGISGIHTHAGPGGYLQYVVYIVTSLGFVRQSFDALVDGIENSIIQAHENLRPGSIFISNGELLDAGVNRSPSAYLNNPSEERSEYKYDTDKEMTLLKFVDDQWGPVGSFNWFATHGTSMSRTNSLISGDNKGAAARLMEDWFEQREELISDEIPRRVSSIIRNHQDSRKTLSQLHIVCLMMKQEKKLSLFVSDADEELLELASYFESQPGRAATRVSSSARRVRSPLRKADKPGFVSAFCQTNCGDVSPNVLGAFCLDTGLPCDFNHSTCGGRNELCYGRGPGYPDEFESTRVIGERQFKKALDLFNKASEELQGKVDYRQVYVDFSQLNVTLTKKDGSSEVVRTCPAAMGFAFAAGTTDGPGAFDFTQGDDKGNPFWRMVRNALKTPHKKQMDCHYPKPILLDTGEMTKPYAWAPSILSLQILRIGKLFILSVPGEFTTMAGRRLRDAVKTQLKSSGDKELSGGEIHVVIAGLANGYSQYVTTFEEYQVQRYEGASTLFGPHTLTGYIQEFKKLSKSLVLGRTVQPGPQPPNLLDKQVSFLTPVVMDSTPGGDSFGDVISDVPKNLSVKRGSDLVAVVFQSACPRNDLLTEGTFALVERLEREDKSWTPVYDDDDLCLRFKWSRPKRFSSRSQATIEWRIPESASPGVYRITHFGAAKRLFGSVQHFTGSSSAFVVT
ncbi:neutral ceramidase 1 isoform X1 [Brassica napus]|uniref:neutral ceramidase 1 isoform X1 n=1 Tax=Brassica napus TaxID=3708 RepID=UPI0020795B3D|nr:neutral ceramidase 1 isoform X1 [Brassica napus]XP_022563464.2 neutral ceramidase 1 isoform X1 [Brassica napus]